MKRAIEKTLAFLARAVVRKYRPKIVGITGTLGKTSTKKAVLAVMQDNFRARADSKSMNTEIGFPLSILGRDMPGRSVLGWLGIFLYALGLLIFKTKKFPEVLVLEYGADKPGDIRYLTGIARPDVAVLTAISMVHMELFGTLENVKKEKSTLVRELGKDGVAVLNADFPEVEKLKEKLPGRVITYSLSGPADVCTSDLIQKWGEGVMCRIEHDGASVPVFVPGVAGQTAIYSVMGGIAAGVAIGLNLVDMGQSLEGMVAPPGRMRYLAGIKNTVLIDDSYNSSPVAAQKALEFLGSYPLEGASKFAVLGGMNELGTHTEAAHEELGRQVARQGIDWLLTVGQAGSIIARAARENGMDEGRVASFDTSPEAGKFLQDKISEGDVILIKGSQNGVFTEEVVKEVMASPEEAKNLLVRQEPYWQGIKRKQGFWVE